VADLGRNHARLALLDLSGALLKTRSVKIDIRLGAVPTLTVIAEALHLLHRSMGDVKLRGVGVSLPGPVDTSRGCADSPAAMPGWHDFNVTGWLTAEFGVIAVADNDANMMALGEHTFRSMRDFNAMSRQRSMLFLKAGASIGCGIILNGHVYRGSTALAGDIAHVKVAAAADRPCSCGNSGCLETIAGGVALVADLRAFGFDVTETADVVRLINNANLAATTQSRVAGRLVGDTMSAIINFFNPDLVVLGGLLGAVDPFAAALRAQLYECCHPLATRMLQIEQTAAGENSGVLGVGQLCLREILTIV
jgi:predicted NBD/HSP70 family sugar kinase